MERSNKIVKESQKKAGEILKNKHLIDYKEQFLHNNYNIQIKHYKIARVDTDKKVELVITNLKDNTSIYTTYINKNMFNISFDGQYLGVCDKRKLHIFDLDNNLSEIETYKDKKCTEVYFSLDNKYLILNNEGHGQIYDFHNANLVYDNPNESIVTSTYPNLILDYVMLENEIILLDEAKRIIVEGLANSFKYVEAMIFVIKDKGEIDILVRENQISYIPFVSFQPYYSIRALQIVPKQQPWIAVAHGAMALYGVKLAACAGLVGEEIGEILGARWALGVRLESGGILRF